MNGPALFELCDVAKSYGRHAVFRGLTLAMAEPEILGIIGPNGAGKTTLLRILLGLVRASRGSVLLRGRPPLVALAHFPVAYFGGESTLPPAPRVGSWARLFNLDSRADRETRRMRALSHGSRQLVGLRTVLAPLGPRLVVLDEPWEGLDPDGSRWLSATLRDKRRAKVGVVVSSHRLSDLAGVCDRYAFLVAGSMTCLSAEQVQPRGDVTADALLAIFDRLRAGPAHQKIPFSLGGGEGWVRGK